MGEDVFPLLVQVAETVYGGCYGDVTFLVERMFGAVDEALGAVEEIGDNGALGLHLFGVGAFAVAF